MGLKKKLGMAVITSALGATMIAGGTFAYFNATATNDNNTFQAGTIKLGQQVNLGDKGNIKPNDQGVDTFTLENKVTVDGVTKVSTLPSDVTAKFGVISGDLAGAVSATIKLDGNVIVAKTPYASLSEQVIDLGDFAANDGDTTKAIEVDWIFDETGTDQNALQGATFNAPVTFEAHQQ